MLVHCPYMSELHILNVTIVNSVIANCTKGVGVAFTNSLIHNGDQEFSFHLEEVNLTLIYDTGMKVEFSHGNYYMNFQIEYCHFVGDFVNLLHRHATMCYKRIILEVPIHNYVVVRLRHNAFCHNSSMQRFLYQIVLSFNIPMQWI